MRLSPSPFIFAGRWKIFFYLLPCLPLFFTLFCPAAVASGRDAKRKERSLCVEMGSKVSSAEGLSLELTVRFQRYNSRPRQKGDYFDEHIYSPKSVFYSPASGQVFVNSLEGMATVVYDPERLTKKTTLFHRFGKGAGALFLKGEGISQWGLAGGETVRNRFSGKPVEFAATHEGRYLWASYYRRSYDPNALLPSAVAIIDTSTNHIERVMTTGPLPKTLASSPDGKWLAVAHWGDNTVGFINVTSARPAGFRYSGLVTVGKKFVVKNDGKKINRDSACGSCLRGAVFTPDSRYLLVGRMKGGGIAAIDVEKQAYLGTVYGMKPTPRHLVLSPDGKTLYLSSNYSGYVSSYNLAELVETVLSGKRELKPQAEVRTGRGTRTIDVTSDGRYLFAAVKSESVVAVVDTVSMTLVMKVPVDPYPVGLNLALEDSQLWVTSQGRKGVGGNSVSVFRITYGNE